MLPTASAPTFRRASEANHSRPSVGQASYSGCRMVGVRPGKIWALSQIFFWGARNSTLQTTSIWCNWGNTMLDSALLCIGFLTKGDAGTLPWFAMACLAMLLHFLCMLSLVALSPVCEKLRWRQLCLACFQTSAGKAGHPWQEPNRSYVKLWICYATTEFINPQIDRRKPYYIPSSSFFSIFSWPWLAWERYSIFIIYWITELLSDSFAYAWMGIMHQGRVEMALPCLVSCSKRRASKFLTTKSVVPLLVL